MGNNTSVTAADGHTFKAYVARPTGTPRGHLVVVQEIFGVTGHIRRVSDKFAEAGFVAAAPALFDRVERDVELNYGEIGRGKELQSGVSFEDALKDIDATRAMLEAPKVAIVGYCWGGTLAYLAACNQAIACAVAYYGGFIAKIGKQAPAAPTMYHFGEMDTFITANDVQRIRELDPDGAIFVYSGSGHGFNCEERADYNAENAALAMGRTLDHLDRHLAP